MYSFKTNIGIFYIIHRENGWHIVYQDEYLGHYHTPQQAVDDLTGGHSDWPSSGVDPSTLGMSNDIADWLYK